MRGYFTKENWGSPPHPPFWDSRNEHLLYTSMTFAFTTWVWCERNTETFPYPLTWGFAWSGLRGIFLKLYGPITFREIVFQLAFVWSQLTVGFIILPCSVKTEKCPFRIRCYFDGRGNGRIAFIDYWIPPTHWWKWVPQITWSIDASWAHSFQPVSAFESIQVTLCECFVSSQ